MMYDWATPGMYGPVHWLVFVAVVAVISYPTGQFFAASTSRRSGRCWCLFRF